MSVRYHKAFCPVCNQENEYWWGMWKLYVEANKSGIPCDETRDCPGRMFPAEPSPRYEDE